ncbi:MAG TPA: DEAD/DEAH box helicase [Candidatus Peregrinibacteria bacterium]|nr:DEAD/DEAH box helicase [Candidatus Peregrinibacteria bacterium]
MSKFEEIALDQKVLRALEDLNFENLTPIQEKVIPHLLSSDRDLIALAQTGTGKTAAFGLPIIQQIDATSGDVQAIIICPTRELCIQIAGDIRKFVIYLEGVSVVPVYGGERIDKQIRALGRKPQIVVGTPGRMLDLIKRRKIRVESVRWFVMDEADEILDMGFKEDLDAILEGMPTDKQTLLFSATMAKNVEPIAKKYMNEPERIDTEMISTELDITHQYYMAHAKDRYKVLRRIADLNPGIYGIIFCRTRRETKEIADKLIQDHYSAEAIHGDLTQDQRDLVMGRFRKKHIQLLVATDVAARGIDVSDLTHIINYSLPEQIKTYIHRSGRTGRAGNSGISLSIIHMREMGRIRAIERIVGKPFEQKQIPLGKEICERQLFHLVEKISHTQVDEAQIEPYLSSIYKQLEPLDREDLIKRFVTTEFSRFLSFYKDAVDLNTTARKGDQGRSHERGKRIRRKRRREVNFSRFKIETGSAHKLGPKRLITLVNKDSKLKRAEIGKIEILKDCSYFEVEQGYEKNVLACFNRIRFHGNRISIKLMRSKPFLQKSRSQQLTQTLK